MKAQGAPVHTAQELVDAVARAQPGAFIEVRPGTYLLPGPLVLARPGPVLLRGAGRPEEVVLSGAAGRELVRVEAPGWELGRLWLRGGGVQVTDSGTGVRLDALRITDATTGIALGDASDLQCALSGVMLTNNVLASIRGNAIRLSSVCDAQLLHQTVWDAGRPLLVEGPSAALRLANNLWSAPPGVAGAGDLVMPAPAFGGWFVAPARLDFHLVRGAPPVDRGVPTPLALDADGRARLLGSAPDVGAYEYELEPASTNPPDLAGSSAQGSLLPAGGARRGQERGPAPGFACSAAPCTHPQIPSGPWAAVLLWTLAVAARRRGPAGRAPPVERRR